MANTQTLYILENETLETWYVGRIKSPGRSLSQNEINEKLYQRYPHLNPYLTLVSNDGEHPGVERWLSKLDYKIKQNPEKSKELKRLLMAGWEYQDTVETSTLTVVSGDDSMYTQLVKNREGLSKCLNTITYKTRTERYQENKIKLKCEHEKFRIVCKLCGGSQICQHNKVRSKCKVCNPQSYLANLRRSRRWNVIKSSNPTHTLDDLCMTIGEWSDYLHKTFEDRYGRPKTDEDEVHIDEIIPCSVWDLPDDNRYCWHYLNSQWLMANDNLSKHASYEEDEKYVMMERIQSSL